MTDQAPEPTPEDLPATASRTKRKRKTTNKVTPAKPADTTTAELDEVAETVAEELDEATAADSQMARPDDQPTEEATAPAEDNALVDVEQEAANEPPADDAPETTEHAEQVPDSDVASDADEGPVASEVEAESAVDEPAAEERTAANWRRETADRAWPTLADYPAAPASAAWTGTADTAWPEPELPKAPTPAAWDAPVPPKRRELGRREAGLALAFLALGVTSGVLIGSTVTVPLAPPAAVSHEATFERTIADAQQRTVTITVDSADGVAGRGAGTIIGKDGTVLTTNAVVRSPGGTIRVTTYNGRTLVGEFVGTDQTTGLTVLRVRGLDAPGFTATSADVGAGARVAVIGQNNNVATTTVASPRQAVNTITGSVGVGTWTEAVRLNTDDDATASGGPIINDSGALVGIAVSGVTTGRESDPERRQYGIDSGVAVTVARNIASTGVALHGRIGAEVTDETAGVLGARITDVADASPAKSAGLRDGDVIVSYNGARIGSAAQLVAAVRGTDPGTKADVNFLRNGKDKATRVQITAAQ